MGKSKRNTLACIIKSDMTRIFTQQNMFTLPLKDAQLKLFFFDLHIMHTPCCTLVMSVQIRHNNHFAVNNVHFKYINPQGTVNK